MERSETANLLSIFSFIFAGIQGLALLFIGLYALMMFGVLIMGATSGSTGDPAAYIVPAVIAVLFGLMAGIGLTNVILNIKLGRALRSSVPPTQKRVIVTSVFNICSFLCGGVFILPFGMALGIFGIVWAVSDKGRAYLNGLPTGLIAPRHRRLCTRTGPRADTFGDNGILDPFLCGKLNRLAACLFWPPHFDNL